MINCNIFLIDSCTTDLTNIGIIACDRMRFTHYLSATRAFKPMGSFIILIASTEKMADESGKLTTIATPALGLVAISVMRLEIRFFTAY